MCVYVYMYVCVCVFVCVRAGAWVHVWVNEYAGTLPTYTYLYTTYLLTLRVQLGRVERVKWMRDVVLSYNLITMNLANSKVGRYLHTTYL